MNPTSSKKSESEFAKLGDSWRSLSEEFEHRPLLLLFIGLASGLAFRHSAAYLLVPLFFCLMSISWPKRGLISLAVIAGLIFQPPAPDRNIVLEKSPFEGEVELITMPRENWEGKPVAIATSDKGTTFIELPARTDWILGDILQVKGELLPMHEAQERKLGARGVIDAQSAERISGGFPVWNIALAFRKSFVGFYNEKDFPVAHEVMPAFGMNQTQGVDSKTYDTFVRTGTTHLIATSGIHVMITAGLLFLLLRLLPIPRWLQIAFLGVLLLVFAGAAGLRPPIIRAVIMSLVMASAYLWRRQPDGLSALGLSGLLILGLSRDSVFDVGFWMSTAAVAALVMFVPTEKPPSESSWELAKFRFKQALIVSVVASLATWPISGDTFGEIAWLSPLTNLIAIPLATVSLWGSVISWLIGLGVPEVGLSLGQVLVELPCTTLVGFLDWVARWDAGIVFIPFFGLMMFGWWHLGALFAWKRVWVGAVSTWSLALAGLIISVPTNFGLASVDYLQVGQGDSTLIREWDTAVLIDVGASDRIAERLIIPELRKRNVQTLAAVVLTHPDLDHIGGVEATLKRYKVQNLIVSSAFEDHELLQSTIRLAESRGARILWISESYLFKIENFDVHVTALSGGSDDNTASLITEVHYSGKPVTIITGDASSREEQALLSQVSGPIPVLKAGHHGSNTSTSDAWLDHLQPTDLVVSCGRLNSFGHPASDVLERAGVRNINVWRTDVSGTISYQYDAESQTFKRMPLVTK
ncbi:MAG: DNA internalization-related competence protein ComEC/Rec2 [Armatimonadetes bacterium]|nr:DNA internalization-related competence protein ComEC/Rec2 [Armatimonadota bacterium]